ncbi:hypothetical protein [Pseudosulfitobacter sp. SM2401]|uniref:hypothetical protein n=1 Tax=Pseudosulfitobacter sp. SM2401 TaxID=3350098 RepID=UPI0036F2BCF4
MTDKPKPTIGTPVPNPNPFDKPTVPVFLTEAQIAQKRAAGKMPDLGVVPAGVPLHACMGLNACAGADRYGLNGPIDGRGPNDCAGQGYCATSNDHTCHVQNNCADQGGCGLYGTGEEMDKPGTNDCRSLGSCATPINAERFSTNGPNKGKSVWLRAREVFKKERWPALRTELLAKQQAGKVPADLKLPEKLGAVPEIFAQTGPTYLWISDDNTHRGNMTSCGASGLSGAGGCG